MTLQSVTLHIAAFLTFLQAADAITIAAASNLQHVMEDVRVAFEKKTGSTVKVSFGSSGQLSTQIKNGAPFDVFLSADRVYAQKLYEEGYAVEPPKLYAYGTLVLWSVKDLDWKEWPESLVDSKIRKIAIANPDVAPYGRESIEVLKHYRLLEKIRPKLVYGQSIAQVNSFITTGAADVGFTSKSAVMIPGAETKGVFLEIDRQAYNPIAQAMILLKSKNEKEARAFWEFLFSPEARRIFQRHGYIYE